MMHETADTYSKFIMVNLKWNSPTPSRSDGNHLVSNVHPLFPHGSESWFRMEDGVAAVMSRHSLHHALRLCLQEVAYGALSVSTDHLSGWANNLI